MSSTIKKSVLKNASRPKKRATTKAPTKKQVDEAREFLKEYGDWVRAPTLSELEDARKIVATADNVKSKKKVLDHAVKVTSKNVKKANAWLKKERTSSDPHAVRVSPLEGQHATVSCPDCAAQLRIGIEFLAHRT